MKKLILAAFCAMLLLGFVPNKGNAQYTYSAYVQQQQRALLVLQYQLQRQQAIQVLQYRQYLAMRQLAIQQAVATAYATQQPLYWRRYGYYQAYLR